MWFDHKPLTWKKIQTREFRLPIKAGPQQKKNQEDKPPNFISVNWWQQHNGVTERNGIYAPPLNPHPSFPLTQIPGDVTHEQQEEEEINSGLVELPRLRLKKHTV